MDRKEKERKKDEIAGRMRVGERVGLFLKYSSSFQYSVLFSGHT